MNPEQISNKITAVAILCQAHSTPVAIALLGATYVLLHMLLSNLFSINELRIVFTFSLHLYLFELL